jgi:hypothetical protein
MTALNSKEYEGDGVIQDLYNYRALLPDVKHCKLEPFDIQMAVCKLNST